MDVAPAATADAQRNTESFDVMAANSAFASTVVTAPLSPRGAPLESHRSMRWPRHRSRPGHLRRRIPSDGPQNSWGLTSTSGTRRRLRWSARRTPPQLRRMPAFARSPRACRPPRCMRPSRPAGPTLVCGGCGRPGPSCHADTAGPRHSPCAADSYASCGTMASQRESVERQDGQHPGACAEPARRGAVHDGLVRRAVGGSRRCRRVRIRSTPERRTPRPG